MADTSPTSPPYERSYDVVLTQLNPERDAALRAAGLTDAEVYAANLAAWRADPERLAEQDVALIVMARRIVAAYVIVGAEPNGEPDSASIIAKRSDLPEEAAALIGTDLTDAVVTFRTIHYATLGPDGLTSRPPEDRRYPPTA